jgi:hypothetical protein
MNRFTITSASIAGAVFLFAQLAVAQDVPATATSSAAHGGYFATYGATRRIEFTANRNGLNEQSGQGSFFNTTTGLKVHFTIDCLKVEGNVATMTGIWDSNGDSRYMLLRVVDNGEGHRATDQVSPLYSSSRPLSCNDSYDLPLFEAFGGNIQVR